MSKAVTMGLVALATCALFACADGNDDVDTTTSANPTEPATPLIDDNGGEPRGPRTADDRGDLASANGARASAISYNHPEPHTLTIPALDLGSGRAHVYQLSLGGGALGDMHTHDVTLSGLQLSTLRDGAELVIESGAGGNHAHTHTITISRR